MGKTTTEMQLVPLTKLVPYVNNAVRVRRSVYELEYVSA